MGRHLIRCLEMVEPIAVFLSTGGSQLFSTIVNQIDGEVVGPFQVLSTINVSMDQFRHFLVNNGSQLLPFLFSVFTINGMSSLTS